MIEPEASAIARVHCNSCRRRTKHSVIETRTTHGSEEVDGGYTVEWRDTYTMLQCIGCDAVCLRHASWFSEEPGEETLVFYPPRVSRDVPRWASELPPGIIGLLYEVYAALHADSRRLAMM